MSDVQRPELMTLDQHGAERFPDAAGTILAPLSALFAQHPPAAAGTRLFDSTALRDLLAPGGPIAALAERLLGKRARPVRAILFDKRKDANWGLGWHQDRVIAVRGRRDIPGYGPWTVKRGVVHVAPPWSVLGAMRTLRVHLDPVGPDNAPLLVSPGSHQLGIIPGRDIEGVVARLGTRACHAVPGDVWAYCTPVLHASAPSRATAHRRVLQLDYASAELPEGIDWLGV